MKIRTFIKSHPFLVGFFLGFIGTTISIFVPPLISGGDAEVTLGFSILSVFGIFVVYYINILRSIL